MKWKKGIDVDNTTESLLFCVNGVAFTGVYSEGRFFDEVGHDSFSKGIVEKYIELRHVSIHNGWHSFNPSNCVDNGALIVAYNTRFSNNRAVILKCVNGVFVRYHSTTNVVIPTDSIYLWDYLDNVLADFEEPEEKTHTISNTNNEYLSAIVDLTKEYAKSVSSKHIYNPIANALYETWKKYNCEKYCREVNNG